MKILDLPGLPEGGDIVEFVDERDSHETEAIRSEIETLAAKEPFIGVADLIGGPATRRLSEVKREKVRWFLRGKIPRGKMTIIAGDGGLGKRFVTMDLAARATSGRRGSDRGAPSDEVALP